jgi:Flp pilus assembly pilin Flp
MGWNHIKRLIVEEEGMEMVEWAIVGVVFAVAGALAWGTLATNVDTAIGKVETAVAG